MVNKAIIKCLLQQLRSLPGGDGYLCRCQEADLKYMVAFEQPHKAVQWCLLVQVSTGHQSNAADTAGKSFAGMAVAIDNGLASMQCMHQCCWLDACKAIFS